MSRRQGELRFPVLSAWVVFCCAWGGTALAQGDVAERIAERRDAAAEQPPPTPQSLEQAEPVEPAGSGQPNRPVTGQAGAATGEQAELPDIPATVFPEDQIALGPSASADASGEGAALGAKNSGWVMNTLIALGVVIGMIFIVRWVARRWGVGGGGVRVASSPIVEVLSRTTVAPRNHVVLLRVGQRILVVNDGTSGMRTLATVDDPDEVAGLLQSVQAASETSMSSSFGKVMSKLSGQWSAADDTSELGNDDSEAGVNRTRGALAGLRDKLNLTAQARRGADT